MTGQIEHYRTIILGAGFGGLGMGAQLARYNDRDFVILEKGVAVGGVWQDNHYPGAACDTEAHLYCYSFFPHWQVSRMYAGRGELLGYLQRLTDHFSLAEHIRFQNEVTSANWLETEQLWSFVTTEGRRYTSRYFVPAWGQLNQPHTPPIAGMEDFRGSMFHSARWDHGVEIEGKRVASIGNAASAVQYVPEIAPKAAHLSVFQRSAHWIMPRNQIVFSQEEIQGFRDNPATFEKSRRYLHTFREDGFSRTQLGTAEQAEGQRIALEHLQRQVPDANLRTKLTPTYEFGCKRILRSDDYFPALMRSNVGLETRSITRFFEEGIVVSDGEKLAFDVVIFGTGFLSQAFQGDLEVTGIGGKTLSDLWSEGPQAYLGLTVPAFPNLFMIYGPNTNLNHNSIITMLEIQQRYVLEAVEAIERNSGAAAVRQDVFDTFNGTLQEEMASSAFSADCSSWYKNAAGKVINNWSGTVDAYERKVAWRDEDYVWH